MKTKGIRKQLLACAAVGACLSPGAYGQNLFDVFFLTDTTGSMGGAIGGVQTSGASILDQFLAIGNVRFGVGEYKDGNVDSFGIRYNLASGGLPILSSDRAEVLAAFDAWGASGGGDTPEDNLFGLRDAAVNVPWREGSQRIIFWFGDAVGLDPASDGTTLASALGALDDNCIEVVALDVGNLDGTGQATAITDRTLDCGVDGGELVALDLGGMTEEEIAAEIERILVEIFQQRSGGGTQAALASGMRSASVSLARTVTRDVGNRLFRLRTGVRGDTVTVEAAPISDAKGGMAKGGAVPMTAKSCRWEVFGQVFFSSEDQDAQFTGPQRALLHPDTSSDTFGGTIGFEYDFNSNWSAGFAVSGASSDVEFATVGDADIDTLALIPYVSYFHPGLFAGADFYADLLYAYGSNDYDTTRLPAGAIGSTEGDSHQLEFTAGLNFKTPAVVHGPYAVLRWLDGSIDGYSESTGAVFPSTDYESLATQLGYQVSYPVALRGGTLVPQGRVAWEHEFEADQGRIGGIPLGELDEDLAVLGAGIGYYLTCGWNVVLDYEARIGSESGSHYVGLKGGIEF